MDQTLLGQLTLSWSYYRNVSMLRRQIEEWNKYPADLPIILVDDGSPEPAEPIVKELASAKTRAQLELYRTGIDLPWTREFARNLAADRASTNWMVMLDIDHVLPAECMETLLNTPINDRRWYRFRRFRVGKADETRKKDFQRAGLPDDAEFGEIHPHIDGFLCRRKHYWKVGGYNEQFCGVLGGGNEFLRRFEALYAPEVFAGEVFTHVYTRHVINDASDWACDRDTKPGKDLWREIQRAGWKPPAEHLTLPWSRVL